MGIQLTRLQKYYLYYTGSFLFFILALAVLEQHGMPPRWIGYAFLLCARHGRDLEGGSPSVS